MAWKLGTYIKDYCANCTLAGVGYIANQQLHLSERVFWFLCISISTLGSWHLIRQYQKDFESKAISLVIENLRPQDKFFFPSVGVCEFGDPKETYNNLTEIINTIIRNGGKDIEYSFDVDDFLTRIIFQNMYSFASLKPYCDECDDCMQCPNGNYEKYAEEVRSSCSELMLSCKWNGKILDCCRYFLPLRTAMGICFLMNSIQTTKRGSKHWLNAEVGWEVGSGILEIVTKKYVAIHILNEEDVPHSILKALQDTETNKNQTRTLQLQVGNIVNDPDVREISPHYRNCRFPNEPLPNSMYKYYSFSACVTDCLKQKQILTCNCTNYNLLTNEKDTEISCDLKGFFCLDDNDILHPQKMSTWHSTNHGCECLPSCTEHEIKIIGKSVVTNANDNLRRTNIVIQSLPTNRYRRQAVRTRLDVVVTIGGILGLFMGASILSGIELLYFFTLRIYTNNHRR